jgi:hypothetical protein
MYARINATDSYKPDRRLLLMKLMLRSLSFVAKVVLGGQLPTDPHCPRFNHAADTLAVVQRGKLQYCRAIFDGSELYLNNLVFTFSCYSFGSIGNWG